MDKPKYITATPIEWGMCAGCAFRRTGNCFTKVATLRLPRCCDRDTGNHRYVFIENTPEGRAAYVAEKLEASND